MDAIGCQTYVRHTHGDTSQTDLLLADPDLTATQLRASLEEISGAILQQEALLSELRSKQQEFERRLGLVVYPVLTLPNEIISRIFVYCLPSHGRVRPTLQEAPLLLAQICRHWRVIALETCELWSSVDPNFKRTRKGIQSLLESWFSRGKEHPLSLTLRTDEITFPFPVGAIIHTVAHRLWRLELCLDDMSDVELANNHTGFPNLRQLAVLRKIPSSPNNHPILLGFSDAPLLSELKIHGDPGLPNLDLYPLLTNLEVHNIPATILHSILQQLPQLLHVTARLEQTTNTIRGPVTIAPSLQSFVLWGPCSNILKSLTLPGLRRLELHTSDRHSSRPDFFRRSACALDHLAIALDQGMDELADCLHAVPTVTSLVIRVIDDDMYSLACALRATPLPVPRLANLVIRVTTPSPDFKYYPLVRALEVRAAHGLVSVQIHSFQRFWQEDGWLPPAGCLDELTTLIADGMDVELRCDDEYSWNGRDGPYETQYIGYSDPGETFP
ncbi:hypothetical protein GGX14DRAFT_576354 [Mycena pura]|uniref:F-box domain-containing protein n=1 Tax=Mycena pura TaxID=153505 RepID=A0AAD6UX39_9AGAR|nr:hypothetical protein GGX14DRAFT_576354 [Mycena pura]